MAKPRPDLSNDKTSASAYVAWLAGLDVVDSVWIHGSRNPAREKQPNDASDWDFVIGTNKPKVRILPPRLSHGLHADLLILENKDIGRLPNITQIWPDDEFGVLNV